MMEMKRRMISSFDELIITELRESTEQNTSRILDWHIDSDSSCSFGKEMSLMWLNSKPSMRSASSCGDNAL